MERKSIQTLVYEELKKNIMSLRLQPGQAMSTQEIATKLNVSRTPVREAFLRLQEEGLVEMIPQRETIVSRIDLKRVDQEKFIRECLELGVVNRFLERKHQEDIQSMTELIKVQKQCAEAETAQVFWRQMTASTKSSFMQRASRWRGDHRQQEWPL